MGFLKTVGVLLAAAIVLASNVQAAELLMFRRPGCPWCAAWDREIGPIYARTDVGRRLPIRFIDLEQGNAGKLKLVAPVRFTPTFVLVDDGREIGRIEGYPGQDFFWARLEGLASDRWETTAHPTGAAPNGDSP
jgi:thioredoxin-related protein